jgi:Arc/MetJ family transcription regulator
MHMRSTLNLDDDLIERARKITGIQEKTALIRAGLEALIAQERARRLVALGGSQPDFQVPPRKRLKGRL